MHKDLANNEQLTSMTVQEKVLFIANTAQGIVSMPEANIQHMHSMIRLLRDSSFAVMKLAALSIAEIFKDIIPLYKINKEDTEVRLKEVISKDERKLLTFEHELLHFYQKYLQTMNEIKIELSNLIRRNSPVCTSVKRPYLFRIRSSFDSGFF
jgi:hypothetical protein